MAKITKKVKTLQIRKKRRLEKHITGEEKPLLIGHQERVFGIEGETGSGYKITNNLQLNLAEIGAVLKLLEKIGEQLRLTVDF